MCLYVFVVCPHPHRCGEGHQVIDPVGRSVGTKGRLSRFLLSEGIGTEGLGEKAIPSRSD